jgi:hypothetical protein
MPVVPVLSVLLLMTTQAPLDSTALAKSIADVIDAEARKSVDHRPPFVFRPDSNSQWSHLVEIQLTARPAMLLNSPASGTRADAVHLSIGKIEVNADTVDLVLTWTRCRPDVAGMNFWQHRFSYRLVRIKGQWQARPGEAIYGEGTC